MNKNPKPCRNTLLFLMKITLVHLMITSVSMVFCHALESNGQTVLDRKVSLRMDNTTVKEVLVELESRAGVSFTYRPRLLRNMGKLSMDVSHRSLGDVLALLFDPSVEYEVVGKQIVLKEMARPAKGSFVATATFQGVQVSGVVRDDAGNAVPGVNVVEKGTTNGTTTDTDGRYALVVTNDDAVLVFSFIGYATQEVSVGGRTSIEIALAPDTQTLQEVIVVGYGEKKKATITGA